jgi:hypothetical protein
MRLSSALLEALKSFNGLNLAARAETLPATDGIAAANRILASKASSEVSKQQFPASIGESVEKAKVDPYLFSPPDLRVS